jgi:hypothetical protein
MNEDEMMDGLTRGLDALELRCVNSVEPWMELKVASTPSTLGFWLGGLVVKARFGRCDARCPCTAAIDASHPRVGSGITGGWTSSSGPVACHAPVELSVSVSDNHHREFFFLCSASADGANMHSTDRSKPFILDYAVEIG